MSKRERKRDHSLQLCGFRGNRAGTSAAFEVWHPQRDNEPRRTKMTTSTKTTKTSLTIKTSVKAGGLATANHNRGLSVRSAVKAGGLATANHNLSLSSVRSPLHVLEHALQGFRVQR